MFSCCTWIGQDTRNTRKYPYEPEYQISLLPIQERDILGGRRNIYQKYLILEKQAFQLLLLSVIVYRINRVDAINDIELVHSQF